MRKVLVFVLALAMILGSFSFAFAAEDAVYSDITGTDCEGAVTVLSAVGVVNGYADGTYKPEGIVTRAEMAKLLIVALGMEDYVGGAYANYKDVPGSHWATSYIAYAASMGIIEGYPDGNFKPDATVTYQEAVTMIVRALGYQDQYLTGTWPASHVSMAKSLGILDDIVATADGANRGDVALMLYNALTLTTVTYNTTGNLDRTGKSMLERLDALKCEAVVLVPDGTNVTATGVSGKVEIADAVDLSAYYGFNVVPYIMQNDDDEWEIIAVGEIKGTAYEVTYKSATTFSYNDDTYTVADFGTKIVNNSSGTVTGPAVDDEVTVIINGTLSKTGTNKVYGTVAWLVTDTYQIIDNDVDEIAASVEDEEDITIDGFDANYDVDDAAYDPTVEGAATALKDLAEDDVVFIYAVGNTGTDIEKVVVSRDTAEGAITKVKNSGDADNVEYTVDGKVYALNATATASASMAVGDEYTFFLDPAGDVYAAEVVDATGDYALLLGIESEANKYDATKYTTTIKVMDNTGAVSELTLKDTTNGGNVTAVKGAIIKYSTNKDGKVTAVKDQNATFVSQPLSVRGSLKNVGTVTDSTVVFTFDGVIGAVTNWSADEDYYDVSSFAKIAGADEDLNTFYVLDKTGKNVEAMIVEKELSGGSDSVFGLINSWANAQDADEEDIFELAALVGGEKEKALVTIDEGDSNDPSTNYAVSSGVDGQLYGFKLDGNGAVKEIHAVVASDKVEGSGYDIKAINGIVAFSKADCVVSDIDKTKGIIWINSAPVDMDDSVTVYKMVFDDDEFDGYDVGSLSNVGTGSYVLAFDTTDDDEENIDILIVVTRADYAKYNKDNGTANTVLKF